MVQFDPTALFLLNLLFGLLLFVPSYLSVLVYTSEKDAPTAATTDEPSNFVALPSSFIIISYLSLCCLIEPFAIYVVATVSCCESNSFNALSQSFLHTVRWDPRFSISNPFTAMSLLGLPPVAVFLGWSGWLYELGRMVRRDPDHFTDRLLNEEYFTGFFPRIRSLGRSTEAPGKRAQTPDPHPA
ncbi:hypothetical protein C8J57DRAFT_1714760 [Mycena rebaudengoi]|nr:hypothetical protein C8J57DRAFT_1714760 [Mycena rebaudengoi]